MTEAKLQPLWSSYQSHKQVYCFHSSAKPVHNSRKKQLYTYLAMLGATFIGHRVRQGMYTIRGKASCTLIGLVKAPFPFPHVICDSVHNSRKKQLYTYLAYESRP